MADVNEGQRLQERTRKMSNVIELRNYLFEALKGVRDGSISVEQAKAVSELSQTIINSAKLEVDYCKATGQTMASGFIEAEGEQRKALPNGILSIRTHTIKG